MWAAGANETFSQLLSVALLSASIEINERENKNRAKATTITHWCALCLASCHRQSIRFHRVMPFFSPIKFALFVFGVRNENMHFLMSNRMFLPLIAIPKEPAVNSVCILIQWDAIADSQRTDSDLKTCQAKNRWLNKRITKCMRPAKFQIIFDTERRKRVKLTKWCVFFCSRIDIYYTRYLRISLTLTRTVNLLTLFQTRKKIHPTNEHKRRKFSLE